MELDTEDAMDAVESMGLHNVHSLIRSSQMSVVDLRLWDAL